MDAATSMPTELPPIPSKRYFTIGEASSLCCVEPHVLRYWEEQFSQLKPSRRRGARRYYTQEDVAVAREIRRLLYVEGYTLWGAQRRLSMEQE